MEIAIGYCKCCKSNIYRSAQGDRCGCDHPKRRLEEKEKKTYILICNKCKKPSREITKNSGRHKKYCSSCMIKIRRREARDYQRRRKAQNRLNNNKYGKATSEFKTKKISKNTTGE